MQKTSFRYLATLLITTWIAFGCNHDTAPAAAGAAAAGGGRGRGGASGPALSVNTTHAQFIPIERFVEVSGTLVSPDQARVSSEVAGKVTDVLVEIGQEVAVGQPLARLDTTELDLAVERAESALRQTQAQLGVDPAHPDQLPPDESVASVRTAAANRDDAHSQLDRARELYSKQVLSKADLDTNETRVKVAEANYQAAIEAVRALKASLQDRKAAYDLAKKKVNDAVIRAPVAGAIAERSVQRGEYIQEKTQIAMIVRMNPLKLKSAVQEKYANLIHENQNVKFNVEPYPGEAFNGRIAFISPSVDQSTRTFAVEVLVDNPARRLKPGLYTTGQVAVGMDQRVLALPEGTISTLAGVSSVFVIKDDGTIKQQTVELGEHQGDFIEVLSGIKGNETLASSNLNQLITGVKVASNASGDDAPAGDDSGASSKGRGGRGGDDKGAGQRQRKGDPQ